MISQVNKKNCFILNKQKMLVKKTSVGEVQNKEAHYMSIHELKGSVLRNLSPTFLHFCIRLYLVSFFLVSSL